MAGPWERYKNTATNEPDLPIVPHGTMSYPGAGSTGKSGPWDKYKDARPDVSQLESALRGGAQGLTLGYADEGEAMAKAVADYVRGKKSVFDKGVMDVYRRKREPIREKYAAAREAHPWTYGTTQFAGAVAPAAAALAGSGGMATPAVAGRLALLAGTEALGHTEADLTKGEFGRAAADTALSAAIGGAFPYAAKYARQGVTAGGRKIADLARQGMEKVAPKARDVAGTTAKRTLSAFTGPSVEAIEARLARPQAIRGAVSEAVLAQRELPAAVNALAKRVGQFEEEAWNSLRPKQKAFNVKDLTTQLTRLQNQLKLKGKLFGPEDKAAYNTLESYKADLMKFAPKVKGTGKMKGKVVPAPEKKILTEGDMKGILKKLRNNTDMENLGAGKQISETTAALRKYQHYIDQKLKAQNPKYKEIMKGHAIHTNLLQKVKGQFGLEGWNKVTPTSRTPTALATAARPDERKL